MRGWGRAAANVRGARVAWHLGSHVSKPGSFHDFGTALHHKICASRLRQNALKKSGFCIVAAQELWLYS